MKKFMASALAIALVAGFTAPAAHANWFSKDNKDEKVVARHNDTVVTKTENSATSTTYRARSGRTNEVHDVTVSTPVGYDATAHDAEAQKWIYNGSSAYRGGLTGQVAVNHVDGDGGLTVHPVRGANSQFGASLRSGDTGQSDETRLNHTFNN